MPVHSRPITIRILQSDGRLEYEATEKDAEGRMKNVVHAVEGPCGIFQTTTSEHLHHENATRCLPIYLDDSEEQTGRIIQQVLREAAGEGVPKAKQDAIVETWHDAMRLLQPGEVVVPFANRLTLPIDSLRMRRDVRKLIAAIRTTAWLHQFTRERDTYERIVATEADFEIARQLLRPSLRQAHAEMTPSEERVWAAIMELDPGARDAFKRRDIKVPRVADRTVKSCLQSLTETGYLDSDEKTGRTGSTYTVVRETTPVDTFEVILAPLPINPLPDTDIPKSPIKTGENGDYLMGSEMGKERIESLGSWNRV